MAGGVRKFEEWRALFEVRGFGPYSCDMCGQPIELGLHYRDERSLIIHHVDEDRLNNRPENLQLVHRACHQAHHHRGKLVSEETRRRMAAAATGKRHTPVTRAKISAAVRAARAPS